MKNKKPDIVVGITKSVAAIEAPKIIRELKRNDLQIQAIMSPASLDIITPELMHWACGRKPITKLSGDAEHVSMFEEDTLFLLCPATLNTISKISVGIADNPVTSCAAVALGMGCRIVVVPAMHMSLHDNPFYQENLKRLKNQGVRVIEPRFQENKAKIAENSTVVQVVLDMLKKG